MMEYCDRCGELTGNAGILDDSIQCESCGAIICEECIYQNAPMDMSCGYTPVWCKDCGEKYDSEEGIKINERDTV